MFECECCDILFRTNPINSDLGVFCCQECRREAEEVSSLDEDINEDYDDYIADYDDNLEFSEEEIECIE